MSAHVIEIADEQSVRAVLAADLATLPILGNIFSRRRLITSRADFMDKLGIKRGGKTEIKFCEIDLLQITDSEDEGFDDCPLAILTYNLHIFHEFVDLRADGSNSDTDFTNALIQLRAYGLNKRSFTIGLTRGIVETEAMLQAEFAQFGNDTFTDCVGHSVDIEWKVYFYV